MRKTSHAFTRVELAAVVAALALLGFLAVPLFALNKSDSERLVCFNNLRLIGRGVQAWAGDHNQQFSWRTLQLPDGGSRPPAGGFKPGAAWFEYAWLSNELVTPKILACPSDTGVRRAASFTTDPNGGFMFVAYRNNSVSYPLHLDGSIDAPKSWLSGDRNFRSDFSGGSCSAGVNSVNTIMLNPFLGNVSWSNAVHGPFGHVLATDGTVEITSTDRLREILLGPGFDDNGSIHFLKAR